MSPSGRNAFRFFASAMSASHNAGVTSKLDTLLEAFKEEMLAKFWARRDRHPRSVTMDDFDWRTELDLKQIEEHMLEEMKEWLDAGAYRADEDVDLANMAFLDWAARKGAINEQGTKRSEF